MNVLWLAICAAYSSGYVWTWRRVSYGLARTPGCGAPDKDDIMFGLLFGAMVSIVWPIAWIFMGISSMSKDGMGFMLPPRRERERLERERLEARIRELESSTGQARTL